MEVLLGELLIPWGWLRLVVLVASVYALVWVFGFYASMVVWPHRLEATGLRARYGALAEGWIPYEAITSIERTRGKAPQERDGLMRAPAGGAAYFAIAGQTELSIRLRTPQVLRGMFGPTPPVTTVHLAVDEPERLARALDARAAPYADAPRSGGAPVAPEPAARGAKMLPEASAQPLRLLSWLLFVAVPVSQKGGD